MQVCLLLLVSDRESWINRAYVSPNWPGRYQPPQTNQRMAQSTDGAASPIQPLVRPPTTSQQPHNCIAPTSDAPGSDLSDRKSSVSQPPPSQDYLDVERLRLLSSSSTTTRPPSGFIRPRSTLSAIPRNRIGGGSIGSLPAVPEASIFDDLSPMSPWIRVDKSPDRHRHVVQALFQPGDAFDVYVDGARFLPDNVTATKVTIAALHADRSKISPFTADSSSQLAVALSEACCPTFNLVALWCLSSDGILHFSCVFGCA
jgi:hypothetical protein